jgi:hypothetical protein
MAKETNAKKAVAIGVIGVVAGTLGGVAMDNGEDSALNEMAMLQEEMESMGLSFEADLASMGIDLEAVESNLAEKTAEAEAMAGENVILTGDVETYKLEVSELKTDLSGIFWINGDALREAMEDEFDRYDTFNGTEFDDDEMKIKYWDEATFTIDVDDDGDGEIIVSDFSIKYDDNDDEYTVEYTAEIELNNGEIDDVDLFEA